MSSVMKTPLFAASGDANGSIDWPAEVMGPSPSLRVLHEVLLAYQANRRRGTSATKTRGLVSGGGRKPWKQKGTGNARSGSIRSPLWRKGGIIFGPSPRSYRQDVPEGKRLIALQTALLEKSKSSSVAVIESLIFAKGKTREAQQVLAKTGPLTRALLVLEKRGEPTDRALRNLSTIRAVAAADLNAWDIAQSHRVLITREALKVLSSRFPKG